MIVWSIDPGSSESGFVVMDTEKNQILTFGKIDNEHLKQKLYDNKYKINVFVIELLTGGRTLGKYTIQTAIWIGRFIENVLPRPCEFLTRGQVLKHFGVKKKDAPFPELKGADAKLRALMIQRWNPPKKLKKDAFQALALATCFIEQRCKK